MAMTKTKKSRMSKEDRLCALVDTIKPGTPFDNLPKPVQRIVEEWNRNKADRAANAFRAYVEDDSYRGDEETGLSDLLGSLRHWADIRGVNFDRANERAAGYYKNERSAPDDITLSEACARACKLLPRGRKDLFRGV